MPLYPFTGIHERRLFKTEVSILILVYCVPGAYSRPANSRRLDKPLRYVEAMDGEDSRGPRYALGRVSASIIGMFPWTFNHFKRHDGGCRGGGLWSVTR